MKNEFNADKTQYWFKNKCYWSSFKYIDYKTKTVLFKLIKCLKNEYGINIKSPSIKEFDDITNPNIDWFNDAELINYIPKINITKYDFLPQTHENKIKNMKNENIKFENLSDAAKLFVGKFKKMIQNNLEKDLSNFYPADGFRNPNSYIVMKNNYCFIFFNDSIKHLMSFENLSLEEIDDIHDFLKSKNYFIPKIK